MTEAGIVILTFNGAAYLDQVLQMITRQKVQPVELLAIDSGSSDATLEILTRNHVRTHCISNAEFSHSGTRNLAARLVESKYIVYLTQDASPADSCWLEMLLQPFDGESPPAATYSRQIPRPGCNALEASDLRMNFTAEQQVRKWPHNDSRFKGDIWKAIHLSNVSTAYDRGLLLENPFDESLPMGEDQEWAKRMMENGHSIAYQPESVVLHSHEHSLREKYERSYRMGQSFSQFLHPLLGRRSFPLPAWVVHIGLDLWNIPRLDATVAEKAKWLLLSPIHRAVTHYAYYRGWNAEKNQTTDAH